MLFAELRGRIDHARQFDDPRERVEIADCLMQSAKQVDRDSARSFRTLSCRHFVTESANPYLCVPFRQMPRKKDKITGPNERRVKGYGDRRIRKRDPEGLQLFVDVHGLCSCRDSYCFVCLSAVLRSPSPRRAVSFAAPYIVH